MNSLGSITRYTLIGFMICLLTMVMCGCPGDDDDDNNDSNGDYFPNVDGSVWNYEVTDFEDDINSVGTMRISGTMNFNGVNCQVIIETDSAYPNEEQRQFLVDNGSEVLTYGFETYENGAMTDSFTFPTAAKYYVYPFSVNQTWDVFSVTNVYLSDIGGDPEDDDLDGDGQPDPLDASVTATVTAQEEVTVPAGAFNAYKIEQYWILTIHSTLLGYDITISGTVQIEWFAPHVGVVRLEVRNPYDNSAMYTNRLQSYDLGG